MAEYYAQISVAYRGARLRGEESWRATVGSLVGPWPHFTDLIGPTMLQHDAMPTGAQLLGTPQLNKGTAFTLAERRALGLEGLLPPTVETIDDQMVRVRGIYDSASSDLDRHIVLRALQDTNEVLFYRFLSSNLVEMLPIVYTPTVGAACQQFSRIYRCPHGLFISYPDRDRIEAILDTYPRDVDAIVVTDGERILGLGDQGIGGMGIPIGKLSLYTAVGGIDPRRTLPIVLDVGTNRPELCNDPLYMGWGHERITGQDYDDFIETFVRAVVRRWPDALLQWEDFAQQNATPLLDRYRDSVRSFNDDIQGTAAVALAAVLAAGRVAHTDIADHRVLIIGAGSAGSGIGAQLAAAMVAAGLSEQDANDRISLIDSEGLLHSGREDLEPYQLPFAGPAEKWADIAEADLDVIVNTIKPTVLIGVSGQPGLFTESAIRAMASHVQSPIVMPLSNPTSRAEAVPADLVAWTDGRALVATGSPFDSIDYDGVTHSFAQSNNVYIFPGLALGVIATRARVVSDAMIVAAAQAVGDEAPCCDAAPTDSILPALADVPATSRRLASAVAKAARDEGLCEDLSDEQIEERIDAHIWQPEYPEYVV